MTLNNTFKFYTGLLILFTGTPLQTFHVDNVQVKQEHAKHSATHLDAQDFFKQATLPSLDHVTVCTDQKRLLHAAQDALHYLDVHNARAQITNPEAFKDVFAVNDVKETLRFIIDTIKEDLENGSQSRASSRDARDDKKSEFRLQDPDFLKKHFTCLRWKADRESAESHNIPLPDNGKIRLTSYGILEIQGNKKKTANYPCALYALHDDNVRTRFTKQQILAGVFEKAPLKSKVTPLAWLSRQGLEDALMQGTVIVTFTDSSRRMFNVDTHNNIPYDRSQKNVLAQKRYWFFRALKSSNGSFDAMFERMNRRKNVVFAGDLYSIGLGKVIALVHKNPLTNKKEMHIGVLADTGGAFVNNLYQLDLYGGVFKDKNALTYHLKQFPPFTRAMILCKR